MAFEAPRSMLQGIFGRNACGRSTIRPPNPPHLAWNVLAGRLKIAKY
jgi:hypothetical protein